MIITHKLQTMDLTHKQNTIRVDVVQDDKYSRDVEFTLTENGVAWKIPDGTTAVVRYKKPDGTGGNYDTLPDGSTAYQINGNVLTVALAPQVCTVPGQVQLSVGLIKGNAEINTFSANIVVHPNPGAEYQSEDYIKLSGAVPNSGWAPNIYLGTDAQGNVVAKEGTSGGGSTSGKAGGYYTPSVTQLDANTMRVAFTPSDSSMPEVVSRDVTLPGGADGKSAYAYAVEGGFTGTEAEFAAKLAAEFPDKLPNPNALTFTGAVTGSYDGSVPVNVEIPSGGSGSNAVELVYKHICDGTYVSVTDDLPLENGKVYLTRLTLPEGSTKLAVRCVIGGEGNTYTGATAAYVVDQHTVVSKQAHSLMMKTATEIVGISYFGANLPESAGYNLGQNRPDRIGDKIYFYSTASDINLPDGTTVEVYRMN